MKFGRLTVLGKDPNNIKFCLCICDCGQELLVNKHNLATGNSKSCGCLQVQKARHRMKTLTYKHGKARKLGHSREYISWTSMKQRCYNKKSTSYKMYGKLGVSVCDRWLNSFESFLEDLGPRPMGYSLDRINCNGDYTPENCRWAPSKLQGRNKKSTKLDEQIAAEIRKNPDIIDEMANKYNTTSKYLKTVLEGKRWAL